MQYFKKRRVREWNILALQGGVGGLSFVWHFKDGPHVPLLRELLLRTEFQRIA